MSDTVQVAVPDIGDFTDVPVVEILVKPGDEVAKEDPLVTLESDKASMDVPSPVAGKVAQMEVQVGDKVSEGSPLVVIELSEAADADGDGPPSEGTPAERRPEEGGPSPSAPPPQAPERGDIHAQVLVLGSGPGGYTAAFRAADLGLDVILVERYETLGGVCLNVGCIPSKALLHIAKVIADAETSATHGVSFGAPEVDLDALRGWKDGVVGKLTGGLTGLAKQRKVRVVRGEGRFSGPHLLEVDVGDGRTTVSFDHAIVAAGSRASRLPGLPYDDPRVIDSTGALELTDLPERLLVIGGGIIGLEMATVYDALGSRITVVELADQLIPGCDLDLVKPLHARIAKRYEAIHLECLAGEVKAKKDGLQVSFLGDKAPEPGVFDRILVAVGREACGAELGLETAGVAVGDRGIIEVDEQLRTNVDHVFAIGDVVGPPMLAHKATHEAKVAAEVISGLDVAFDVRGIPSVAYTDPEVAWVGLTEIDAAANNTPYEKAAFPWAASGRALSLDAADGLTKILFDPESMRVLGAGIVGPNAGELIAETGLALEMGADAGDIGLTVHAHPTLAETVAFAAELAEGTITDLPAPRKKRA